MQPTLRAAQPTCSSLRKGGSGRWKSAHSAAEAGLREATARIDEMEQLASQSQAQIMFLERELSNAEHRARDAELKAMEAEEEESIPSRKPSAANCSGSISHDKRVRRGGLTFARDIRTS